MSIVNVDFGVSPMLKKGDLVRVENAYFPSGEAIDPDPHGIVVRVGKVFRHGELAGQARCADVGVPWDDEDPEESMGWFILEDTPIDNIIRTTITIVADSTQIASVFHCCELNSHH